jgi:solute carrier family 13 (sodium-dependent dicarboxylate transporter), member 2/3/5
MNVPPSASSYKFTWLLIGVAIALLFYFLNPFGLTLSSAKVLAVGALMITWWISEALPMPVVALVPLVLFPLLRISSLEQAAGSYSNPVIFLFMGGFMLGLAIEKWNLHRRIALSIVKISGTSGDRIVLGFILATGLISMWLSNTATTMMMFPIALSVIAVMKEHHGAEQKIANFSLAIMLSIAYASNIGGIATIVGTPPNVAYVDHIHDKYHYEISFVNWMLVCAPVAILLLFALYLVLVKWLFRNNIRSSEGTGQLIRNELKALGPVSAAEKRVLWIFGVTAFLWITRKIINDLQDLITLDDNMIAVASAISLFICPSGMRGREKDAILEWNDTSKMAWGILLLFGGGIALANALDRAGLIQQLGVWLGQFSQGGFILLLVVVTLSLFISEVMSNVAQVIVFGPVISALADALGMNPLLLGIPMTLAASCASMLPMGTPPNAIVFSSGYIGLKHMTRAGLVMNIVSIILITLFGWFVLPVFMKM